MKIETDTVGQGPVGVHMTVSGDVDAETAVRLHAELQRVAGHRPVFIRLDLTQVTHFSCAGITAVLGASRRLPPGGLVITAASRPVRRLLEILDLGSRLGQPAPGTAQAGHR